MLLMILRTLLYLLIFTDEGGLYRARGQNNARGAQQVKDTYETHTERPIDQMEAEEVEEVSHVR